VKLNIVFVGLLFIATTASAAGWKWLLAARSGDLAAGLAGAVSLALAFAAVIILARIVSAIPRGRGPRREV